jgi:hypothetical protein
MFLRPTSTYRMDWDQIDDYIDYDDKEDESLSELMIYDVPPPPPPETLFLEEN